jgi:hypothetical protein
MLYNVGVISLFAKLVMNHVNLDNQDEIVKRFVLSVSADPSGSVLELNGKAVACIVPPSSSMNGAATGEEWTAAKNARRAELIKRKYADGLAPAEVVELAGLQEAMLRYRQMVAPLPLDDACKLHQELLSRAAAPPGGNKRPEGVAQSCHSQRQRGELPETY